MFRIPHTPVTAEFIADDASSAYAFRAHFGNTIARYHNKVNETSEHRFEFPGGAAITFQINANVGALKTINSQRLGYDDIDYEMRPDEIKEAFYLRVRPPRDYIEYIVITEGDIFYTVMPDGTVVVKYDDITGAGIGLTGITLSKPFLIDADENRNDDVVVTESSVRIKGSTYNTIIYSVDTNWLDNATYPVVVDPSVIINALDSSYVSGFHMSSGAQAIRANNGNMILYFFVRQTSTNYYGVHVLIADGDDFTSPTEVVVSSATGSLYYKDNGSIVKMANGDLILSFREITGSSNREYNVYRSQDNGATWSYLAGVIDKATNVPFSATWNMNGACMIKTPGEDLWIATEDNKTCHL